MNMKPSYILGHCLPEEKMKTIKFLIPRRIEEFYNKFLNNFDGFRIWQFGYDARRDISLEIYGRTKIPIYTKINLVDDIAIIEYDKEVKTKLLIPKKQKDFYNELLKKFSYFILASYYTDGGVIYIKIYGRKKGFI